MSAVPETCVMLDHVLCSSEKNNAHATMNCWSSSTIFIKLRFQHSAFFINTDAVSYQKCKEMGACLRPSKCSSHNLMFFAFPKSPQVHTMCRPFRSATSIKHRFWNTVSYTNTYCHWLPELKHLWVWLPSKILREMRDVFLFQTAIRHLDAALSWLRWTSI